MKKSLHEDKMVFVEECKSPKSVTILLRASSKMVLDEYHRAVLSTIILIKNFISKPSIVIGGGAVGGINCSLIRKKALEYAGKEQIVLMKFAEALEEIPLTIAKNSGMNIIDTLIQLKTKLSQKTCNNDIKWFGINLFNKNIEELDWEIIEPTILKEQVLNTLLKLVVF